MRGHCGAIRTLGLVPRNAVQSCDLSRNGDERFVAESLSEQWLGNVKSGVMWRIPIDGDEAAMNGAPGGGLPLDERIGLLLPVESYRKSDGMEADRHRSNPAR